MPLHDFYCPHCNRVSEQYVPVDVGAAASNLHCSTCRTRLTPIPGAPALHYGSVKTAAFKAFDTTDGRGMPVHIDSLKKLRQVERESERAFRNGEGQPMVFRRWSQDGSNRDQHTLHPSYDGGERPTKEAARRFGSTLQKSAEAPDAEYGPGVNDSNASALAMSGKE